MKKPSIAIVGSGISGIATAYFLHKAGFYPDIIEASAELGGRIAPRQLLNRDVAIGGKNIGKRYQLFREMIHDLEAGTFEYFGLNTSRIVNGKIKTFDTSNKLKGYLGYLQHATLRDVLRILPMILNVKRNRENGDLGGPYFQKYTKLQPPPATTDFFSKGFVENFIRPMTIRMNGAEPETVPVANLGSNLNIILDSYEQLIEGFSPLLIKINQLFSVYCGSRVTKILFDDNKITGLCIEKNGIVSEKKYDHVILATPANIAATLLQNIDPTLSNLLTTIRYNPLAVIVAEYENPVFTGSQRALVFPRSSKLSNAGAYGVNDLNVVRYTFSGEAATKAIQQSKSLDKLLDEAEQQLARYFPITDNKRLAYVGEIMPTGLCAYSYSHHQFLQGLEAHLKNYTGLSCVGDYVVGASIENCMRSAKFAVDRLLTTVFNSDYPVSQSALAPITI